MYLVTSEQMRCFDNSAIETHQIPGIVLMDHAGRSVANHVAELQPRNVLVICGKGNNGGDGWTAARWLHHYGYAAEVRTVVEPDRLVGHARTAFEMADASGVPWRLWYVGDDALTEADVLVDAIMGTGCTRPLEGIYRDAVAAMNACHKTVIAVDVPTGVDATTGEVHGIAVNATKTIAMQCEKLGTAVTPGVLHAGRVVTEDIGIRLQDTKELASYVDSLALQSAWGDRSDMSHKGTFGRVGIWMGTMQGAAVLSAAGAARVGVGLVVIGMEQGARLPASIQPDYVVRQGQPLAAAFHDCQAVVIGPGLGEGILQLQSDLRSETDLSKLRGVIDADGLQLVRGEDGIRVLGDGFVLTPHPKECARLLGWTTADVQRSRIHAATKLAEETGAVVLLKGFRTVIASPSGRLRINPTGNASLAVGGSGDVLSGVIGSLMAQGLDSFSAASIGAWLHGYAGELAGEELTSISTTASDIVAYLPKSVRAFIHARD